MFYFYGFNTLNLVKQTNRKDLENFNSLEE